MSSLLQGLKFKNSINKIIADIKPELQIIQEPMENRNDENDKIILKEDEELKLLNNEFNETLSKYVAVYNNYSNDIIKGLPSDENELNEDLIKLNDNLINIAQKIYDNTNTVQNKDITLEKTINIKKSKLQKKIEELKKERAKLIRLQNLNNTLSSDFTDKKSLVTSFRITYLGWTLGAIILIFLTIKHISK